MSRFTVVWLASILGLASGAMAAEPMEAAGTAPPKVCVRSFQPEAPLNRAQRPAEITGIIENPGNTPVTVTVRLVLPGGVQNITEPNPDAPMVIGDMDSRRVGWRVVAQAAQAHVLTMQMCIGDTVVCEASLPITFLPPVEIQKQSYIPEPEPVQTPLLVGAHNCPLWEAGRPEMWSQLIKHPERTPALGFYAQENPEVADWETKWAVEHGVGFFIYCWYRAEQGRPVTMNFCSAIHEAFFKSRFADKMKFTIMWENQSKGKAGVADEADLMQHLLPFWIENYFKHPSYLKVDNKPLLFIYRPEFLTDDLGSVANVAKAFERMRQACKEAGFDGLYILGEYRGLDPAHLALMKDLGLDYTFAYVWHVPDNPTPQQAIDTQLSYIEKTRDLGIIPQVVTVSQAWSGWNDEGTIWKIPPEDFKTLLRKAKDIIATFPGNELGSKMLLLDNWNEWGEGHYIAPYREYGFGYLDAVRDVLSNAPGPHTDLLPEDIGMGPYDTEYRSLQQREEALRREISQKAVKSGAPEDGLIGWWAFDEQDGTVALDYSGGRLGGRLRDATRARGIDGNALVCDGGCVEVPNAPRLSPTRALSIECWVKTDQAGQDNKWMVNRVFNGGTATGYRLGLLAGKPCFETPVTPWSHHLSARDPLPLGRWVHLAGVFDGAEERLYVDGEEQGRMERPGPVAANSFHLCLGSYEVGHAAHFTGLLDEVKLYNRALAPEEIREHFGKGNVR